MIEQILQTYGIDFNQIWPVQKGYRNQSYPVELPNGQLINLIIYKNEPGILTKIKHANLVANYAAQAGLPARQTYRPSIMQIKSPQGVRYAALYNYLPGQTIPWESYTQNHLKLLGLALARLHCNLNNLQLTSLPSVIDEYAAICHRMKNYFKQSGVQAALKDKLLLLPPLIEPHFKTLHATGELPNHQVLHMDFVRGNILFFSSSNIHSQDTPTLQRHPRLDRGSSKLKNSLAWIPHQVRDDVRGQHPKDHTHYDASMQLGDITLTGILDFEKTALGPPILDVARSLAFLLVDSKFKTERQVRKYFLQSGYIKRGKGDLVTSQLEPLIDLFLTYDLYKFLRHNPYESLLANEHFNRTCAILRLRKGIHPT